MDRRNFFKAASAVMAAPMLPKIPLPTEKSFDYSRVYMSREALEDIRNWGVEDIDDETKREIYQSGFYGWSESGFAVMDNRRVVLGEM
jgi:hypothetical protein